MMDAPPLAKVMEATIAVSWLRVAVNIDRLAGAEAHNAGDRDDGCARAGGGAQRGCASVPTVAMTADSRSRTGIDGDGLASGEVRDTGNFEIGCAGG